MTVTLLTGLICALLHVHPGYADTSCDLYASPSGSDSAAGTASAPLDSPQALANALSPGQTGCFMPGTYGSMEQGVKVSTAGITLTSAPGTEATVVGRLWIARGADDVTVSHLSLNGRNDEGEASPVVNAAGTTFDDDDVTNEHTAICFVLGSEVYGVAEGTLIENSHIHDCGRLPAGNHDHGIYVADSRNIVIRDNWIYDNADRGIQLYPQAVGSHIYGNVIDGNGQGIIFSGVGGEASTGNVVEDNVISNSKVRWNAESFWEGTVGSGNVFRNNCVWASNEESYYDQNGGVQTPAGGATGFSAQGNMVADPEFVDRARGDYNLRPGSACAFTQGGGEAGGVTLEQHQQTVTGSTPIVLTGHVASAAVGAVTILRWKHGAWHKFARRRIRGNDSFHVRKRLRGSGGRERLRAMVPGAGISPVVEVKLLPGGGRHLRV